LQLRQYYRLMVSVARQLAGSALAMGPADVLLPRGSEAWLYHSGLHFGHLMLHGTV
jgi:hypothetical protein